MLKYLQHISHFLTELFVKQHISYCVKKASHSCCTLPIKLKSSECLQYILHYVKELSIFAENTQLFSTSSQWLQHIPFNSQYICFCSCLLNCSNTECEINSYSLGVINIILKLLHFRISVLTAMVRGRSSPFQILSANFHPLRD